MISLQGMVSVVIYLIVAGLIFWLLWWLVDYINPPEPFKKIANVILAIVAVLVVIGILLSLVNGTPIFRADRGAPSVERGRERLQAESGGVGGFRLVQLIPLL